jgi:hypothetical protein
MLEANVAIVGSAEDQEIALGEEQFQRDDAADGVAADRHAVPAHGFFRRGQGAAALLAKAVAVAIRRLTLRAVDHLGG